MDRGARLATVRGVPKSWKQLNDKTTTEYALLLLLYMLLVWGPLTLQCFRRNTENIQMKTC